jgi:hypothetical protein
MKLHDRVTERGQARLPNPETFRIGGNFPLETFKVVFWLNARSLGAGRRAFPSSYEFFSAGSRP